MQNGRRKTPDEKLDEALENTFPSSDPVSISQSDPGHGSPQQTGERAAESVKNAAKKTARAVKRSARRIETRARTIKDRAASKLSELMGRSH